MSVTVSPPKGARFIFRWKLDWSKFENQVIIDKSLITVFNNVPLYWVAALTRAVQPTSYDHQLALYHMAGPSSDFRILNVSLKDLTNVYVKYEPFYWHCDINLRYSPLISPETRAQLIAADQLFCQIDIEIPVSAFKFVLEAPVAATSTPAWIGELFKCIDDKEKSVHSNATVISSDGVSFYCHQLMLQCQSEALAAILRHPPAEGQQEGEYRFPALNGVALKALLEFLYTGKVNAAGISAMEWVALADAAEQYGLKKLKETCAAFLWKQAVDEPVYCVEIIRFCDLHDDLKLVKQRAIAVLAENYETLQLYTGDLVAKFGGGTFGTRLASEVNLFMRRRVEPVEIV